METAAYSPWKEPEGWVAQCIFAGVTTCAPTSEKALKNLQEAIELYLEDTPENDFPRKNIQFGNLVWIINPFSSSFSK